MRVVVPCVGSLLIALASASACTHAREPLAPHAPPLAAAPPAALAPAPDPDLDTDEGALAVDDPCPDERDPGLSRQGCADQDAVLAGDRCPDQPETVNDFEDADGCPDADPPHVVRLAALAREVQFPRPHRSMSRAAELDARAAGALREVAAILRDHPHLGLEIQSHIAVDDEVAYARVDVSQRRAASVLRYLVHMGIDAYRLVAVAHGADRPLDTNKTAAGRARNRRIEFIVRPHAGPPPASPAPQ